jgi:hypothetical protein
MASSDSILELTWGRPPGLSVVSLQATMVENLRALRAALKGKPRTNVFGNERKNLRPSRRVRIPRMVMMPM